MGKPDIVLIPEQPLESSQTVSPLILTQICPSSKNFQAGLVELKVLKSHRQLVIDVKEIGLGVTVIIVIIRNGVQLEEISLTNLSDSKVTFDLEKNDVIAFGYLYPTTLLPPPKMDFKLSIIKKC